jgi:hypothetical protein
MSEGLDIAWPEGEKDRFSSDIREGKRNRPYQGPSGTNGEITGHKGIRLERES